MAEISATTQVAAIVPISLANDLRDLAQRNERSTAAEVRLALRAWIDESTKAAA